MPEALPGAAVVAPHTAAHVLDCIELPVVVVSPECQVASFNAAASALLSLGPADVGRPLAGIRLLSGVKDLEEACRYVIAGGTSTSWTVRDEAGSCFSLRIGPCKASNQGPAGALLTLTNVTALSASLQQAVEEREYTKAIMNTVIDPLVVVDQDLRVQAANQPFHALFQTTREACRSALLYTLGKPDWDVGSLRALVDRARSADAPPEGIELEHEFPTIGRRVVMFKARRLDRPRSGAQILLALQDITERKQVEEALRRRTEQFQALVDEAPLGVYLVDADFRIRQVNPTARQVFGDIPDLVGRDFDQVIHMLWPAEVADDIVARFRVTLATGVPYSVQEYVEERLDRRAREHYEWQINRIPLPDGGYGVVCYFRDISLRVRARLALAEAEQRFRFMAESMPQKIFTAKPDGDFDYVNPQWTELTGLTCEHICAGGWPQFVHAEDLDENLASWRRAVESGEPFLVEHRFRRADGQYRWHITRALPRWDGAGNVLAWVGSSTDVHELQEIQEALKNADRIKDEFLAVLSHELRTPLNAIVGWAHVLQQGGFDAATSQKAVDTIMKNARLQSQLIADVLDVSRIVAGKLRLELRPTDPAEVVRATLDTMEPARGAKAVHLDVDLESGLPVIWVDAGRLQQAVWNLLSNAIKFVPVGGHVRVCMRALQSEIEITIEDDGPGIDPDLLPYVFDRFRQGDSSSIRRHHGLGLGLAIVKHVVELHGGTVNARNRAQGPGAVFEMRLPFPPAHDVAPAPGLDVGTPMPHLGGVHALVVDDEQDSRDVLATILRRCGAEVSTAASAAEAFATFQRLVPDVLLSDIAMPDEDGYSLIHRIRGLSPDRGGRTPAAAVTARASLKDRVEILRQGFQAHVAKPLEPVEVATVVATLVARKG